VNISDLKPRPLDFERCPFLSEVIIIFMKKEKWKNIHFEKDKKNF
jgi:hypothetical protein